MTLTLSSPVASGLERTSLADTDNKDPHFHQQIFTPPNEGYDVQATELWWGNSKNYVGVSPQPHTTMAQLQDLMREGLYGFPGVKVWQHPKIGNVRRWIEHAPMDAALTARMIRHCHDRMNAWIARGDLVTLSGTIDRLVVKDNFPETFIVRLGSESDSETDSAADEIDLVESEGEDEDGSEIVRNVEVKAQHGDEKQYCVCRSGIVPASGDGGYMVQCDECKEWFHPGCVGLPLEDPPEGEWRCEACSSGDGEDADDIDEDDDTDNEEDDDDDRDDDDDDYDVWRPR